MTAWPAAKQRRGQRRTRLAIAQGMYRFMVREHAYPGIRNQQGMEQTFDGYDECEYSERSRISYTAHFFCRISEWLAATQARPHGPRQGIIECHTVRMLPPGIEIQDVDRAVDTGSSILLMGICPDTPAYRSEDHQHIRIRRFEWTGVTERSAAPARDDVSM
jgi:hypothetical protein